MTCAPFLPAKTAGPHDRAVPLHDSTIGWRLVNGCSAAIYGIESMPDVVGDMTGANRQAGDRRVGRD